MNEIKQIRQALGLTQKGLAERLGMGKHGGRTVRRWEAGDLTPHPHTMTAIRNLQNLNQTSSMEKA